MDGIGGIDRETTTPFHLKLFYKTGGFHRPEEFTDTNRLPEHAQVYTWQTCNLRELSHLLVSAVPSLLPTPYIGTRLSYRLIFPDTRPTTVGSGRYITKDLGSVVIGDGGPGILSSDGDSPIVAGGLLAGPLEGEPERTLQEAKFVIGDYVCCAVMPPLDNGEVAPPVVGVPARGGHGFGGGARGGARGGGDYGRGGGGGFAGGGYRGGRGGTRGGGGFGQSMVPAGEWRRGERVPDGPSGGSGRGRGYGGGYGARGRGW